MNKKVIDLSKIKIGDMIEIRKDEYTVTEKVQKIHRDHAGQIRIETDGSNDKYELDDIFAHYALVTK